METSRSIAKVKSATWPCNAGRGNEHPRTIGKRLCKEKQMGHDKYVLNNTPTIRLCEFPFAECLQKLNALCDRSLSAHLLYEHLGYCEDINFYTT